MRLPHHIIESQYFIFEALDELLLALSELSPDENRQLAELSAAGLPPIISRDVLATMLGVNPGLVWSLERRTRRHYRTFNIVSGTKTRTIRAPRVALKIFQKWLSYHLQRRYAPPDHVFGFVPGRSHIDAANIHCNAVWVHSFDIKDFFPSTPISLIMDTFVRLGYPQNGAKLLSSLCCLDGYLPQGAPTSPVLSNFAFSDIDQKLSAIARARGLRLTRYADDIVFSGTGNVDPDLQRLVIQIVEQTSWRISPEKNILMQFPGRLKVHGLLVHGTTARLTKGYRNRLRAYKHLIQKGFIEDNRSKILGHLNYDKQVRARSNEP